MKYVVSSEEMANIDTYTIEEIGISSLVLMGEGFSCCSGEGRRINHKT